MNLLPVIFIFISPFISLFVHVLLALFTKIKISYILSLTLLQSLLILSRSIPVIGADDLLNYYSYYKIIPSFSFTEFFHFFRFEPFLYSFYFLSIPFDLSINGILFLNSFITLFFFNYACLTLLRYFNLPYCLYFFVLVLTPYELVSNTPRLILATSILLLCFITSNKVLFSLLAFLTHKFTFFLYFLYRFSTYKILLSSAFICIILFKDTLINHFNYPVLYRLIYYIKQDSGSLNITYLFLSFCFLVMYFLIKKQNIKSILLFSLFFSFVCFILSPYGSLSTRISFFLPIVFVLSLFTTFRIKNAQLTALVCASSVPLIYLRFFYDISPGTHDIFSSGEFFILFPFKFLLD